MGFLSPKAPKPKPPPNPAIAAQSGEDSMNPAGGYSSLISTTAQGLKRKANTQRTSLLGGG